MTGSSWVSAVGEEDLLIVSPPGCGKTEALAQATSQAVDGVLADKNSQVLAVTFADKAKVNLQSRINHLLSERDQRRVCVMTFHGLAFRLIRSHGVTLGLSDEILMPQRGWIAAHLGSVASAHGLYARDLDARVRAAKAGAVDDNEVFARMEGSAAMLAYEQGLRESGALDFHDAIRHSLRLLELPEVSALYCARFPVLLVDECQDMTRSQFKMVDSFRPSSQVVLAGDEDQAIYSFAGADKTWVYDRLARDAVKRVPFDKSYRSSPEVLRVVSAVRWMLGGPPLKCADPEKWEPRGMAIVRRYSSTMEEAQRVLKGISDIQLKHPDSTFGVISRARNRQRDFCAEAERQSVPVENWELALHHPSIVQLLKRHVDSAVLSANHRTEQLQHLYLACFADLPHDDLELQDSLLEAMEELRCSVEPGGLSHAVSALKGSGDTGNSVSPGIHVLTAHKGKGQEFDYVIAMGLEEDILPSYMSKKEGSLDEELAVLYVMLSRARYGLIVTCSADVRNDPSKPWRRQPSRWLAAIEEATVK